jgi:hypothetical protein
MSDDERAAMPRAGLDIINHLRGLYVSSSTIDSIESSALFGRVWY